jgi:hypothetical protein
LSFNIQDEAPAPDQANAAFADQIDRQTAVDRAAVFPGRAIEDLHH